MTVNRRRAHTETVFELIQLDDRPIPVDVELDYDAEDPYAVRMDLTLPGSALPGGEPVCWVVGRELLAAGLHAPAGEGDVRLRPIADDVALLELRAGQGETWFQVPISEIAEFLDESYEIVPQHRESDWLDDEDFEHVLRAMLDAAADDVEHVKRKDC